MQRVTVLYPNKDGAHFDFDYYMQKHIPMVEGLTGNSVEVRRGLFSATGGAAPFVCVATIHINSVEEYQAMFAKHGAAIMADVPKYTNIEPFVQFDEILE